MSNDKSGFTIRAILIFIFFTVLVGMWTQRNELIYAGPKLSDHVPPAGGIGVLVLLLLIGGLLRKLNERLCLGKAELVLIYSALVI